MRPKLYLKVLKLLFLPENLISNSHTEYLYKNKKKISLRNENMSNQMTLALLRTISITNDKVAALSDIKLKQFFFEIIVSQPNIL